MWGVNSLGTKWPYDTLVHLNITWSQVNYKLVFLYDYFYRKWTTYILHSHFGEVLINPTLRKHYLHLSIHCKNKWNQNARYIYICKRVEYLTICLVSTKLISLCYSYMSASIATSLVGMTKILVSTDIHG